MEKQELEELFDSTIENCEVLLKGRFLSSACAEIDLQNLKQKTLETIDQIQKDSRVGRVDREKNRVYFSQFVGSGTGESNKGRKIEYQVLLGKTFCEPMVKYKNNYYILSWQDILRLAENAGLFDETTDK